MGLISRVSSRTYRKKVQNIIMSTSTVLFGAVSEQKIAEVGKLLGGKVHGSLARLVKSRVKPQRSKPKKRGRRRPAEPLDELNTTDDSSWQALLLAVKRRDQIAKLTDQRSRPPKPVNPDHKNF